MSDLDRKLVGKIGQTFQIEKLGYKPSQPTDAITFSAHGEWFRLVIYTDPIKQAFKEEGYRKIPNQADIQHLIDDGIMSPLEVKEEWERQAIKDGWAPFTPDGKVKVQELINKRGLMTAQEWYDKFEIEMDKIQGDPNWSPIPETFTWEEIEAAAKKAAGIK